MQQNRGKTEKSRIVELIEKAPKEYTLLCNLSELNRDDLRNIHEWNQSARWIRYEEDVEVSGLRWSKPFVASLSSFCVFQVKSFLQTAVIILDATESTWPDISKLIGHKLVSNHVLEQKEADYLVDELKLPIINLYKRKAIGSVQQLIKAPKAKALGKEGGQTDGQKSQQTDSKKQDENFDNNLFKKLPPDTEGASIFVGSSPNMHTTASVIVRLKNPQVIPDVTEVPIPCRFIVVIFGPEDVMVDYKEVGKSIGTLMVDEVFRKIILKAESRHDLLIGIDEFISSSTMLPPSEWENNVRLDPPNIVPNYVDRIQLLKDVHNLGDESSDSDTGLEKMEKSPIGDPKISQKTERKKFFNRRKRSEQADEHGFDDSLKITRKLFGGLREDIKRKLPFYLSDFKDSLDPKCFGSFFFLYFACIAPIITFGGLLYQETGGYLGTMESLFSGSLVGILFALFSGQPLIIMGSTGPVLVFEKILYNLCNSNQWDYLSFRLWVGLWIALLLFLVVMFDLSALVKYITPFTEEAFAFLIALIYVIKAIEKLIDIHKYYEVDLSWEPSYRRTIEHCYCNPPFNKTELQIMHEYLDTGKPMDFPRFRIDENIKDEKNLSNWKINWTDIGEGRYTWQGYKYTQFCESLSGSWTGSKCDKFFAPDIFFFSCILCFGTFIISYKLKMFKNQPFFSSRVRKIVSDFSVLIAVIIMTVTDYFLGLHTLKLNVPLRFEPTLGYEKRGWYVPFFNGNPWWTSLIAVGPALLGAVLIFMDQQITAVIINRKENKLVKGVGYHLDLLVVTVTIVTNSFLGIPYFVAATVLSMNHVLSLKVESKIKTPGEKAKFNGCKEQRVTALTIFIVMGLSVFLAPVLQRIPMAVLYGIFLYMGVVALKDITFFNRILLFFIPVKYQSDLKFLRHIRLRRVHLFTLIQVLSFVMLYVVKSIQKISILFPIMVVAMCFIRKLLDYVFTQYELKHLDANLPPITLPACCCKRKQKKESVLKDSIGLVEKESDNDPISKA